MNFSLKPFRHNISQHSGHANSNQTSDIADRITSQSAFALTPEHISGKLRRHTAETHTQSANNANRLGVTFNPIETSSFLWPTQLQYEGGPQRQDGLWESTCFECFIGLAEQETYIEINVSPSGHWQAYLFSSYRQFAGVCHDVALIDCSVVTKDGSSSMSYQVDIQHPDFVTADWKISVSAVLDFPGNDLRYYASRHIGSRPDFHLAELRDLVVPAN